MARAVRRAGLTLALPALVGASTLLHWLAGRRLPGLWIMPDEAIYAERALTVWRSGVLPLLRGQGAGYGILYPVLAGFPLSVGSFSTGYASLKLLQALVVSLAAVPVFAYGRRLMPPGYALLAATLTVASPVLLYSGLVMTEVLFYPLAALTLLAVAHAVATGARRDQVIAIVLIFAAVLTRVQAVVFVGVFACAILVDAAFRRDRSRLRAFWPVWSVVAVAAIFAVATPGVFGSYAGTLDGGYPLGPALGLTWDHLAYAALMTAILPFAALVALLFDASRRRERDPEVAALLAVSASAVVLLVVQVGFFASLYAPHLLGRDLAAVAPPLFLVFCLWLHRGGPDRRPTTVAGAFVTLAVLLTAPWNHFVADYNVFPDTFGIAPLLRIHSHSPADVVLFAALVALALFVAVPRRLALVLPLLMIAALTATSVVASNEIARRDRTDQQKFLGSTPNWIDRAVHGHDVAYVYDGETYWNTVWQTRFWNRRIRDVLAIAPARVPGPMHQTVASPRNDGLLPIRERYVVASDLHAFVGTPVAHLTQLDLDVSGLTLWHLAGPPRLLQVVSGVIPNGDIAGEAAIVVYGCGGGRLELTLLPKATDLLTVALDGKTVLRTHIRGLQSWDGSVAVPRPRGPRICVFTIHGGSLLGSTRIQFVRA